MRYKFRGKRLDNGEWVYGFYLETQMSGVFILGSEIETKKRKDGITMRDKLWQHEVLPESVGQWTGLVDKHGKEIFEGDMVKAENTQNVGEIKYVHEHGSFLVYSHDENGAYYEYLDIGLCEKYFEVIGNVFDNGDLYDC